MEEKVVFHIVVPKVFRKEVPVPTGPNLDTEQSTEQDAEAEKESYSFLPLISLRKSRRKKSIQKSLASRLYVGSSGDTEKQQKESVDEARKLKTITLHPRKIVETFLYNIGVHDYSVHEFTRRIPSEKYDEEGSKRKTSMRSTGRTSSVANELNDLDHAAESHSDTKLDKKNEQRVHFSEELPSDSNQTEINHMGVVERQESIDDVKLDDTILPLKEMALTEQKNEEKVAFMFSVEAKVAEMYLLRLETLGVGNKEGFGTVSILPCNLSRSAEQPPVDRTAAAGGISDDGSNAETEEKEGETKKDPMGLKKMRDEVAQTVKSRVAVDNVVILVNSGAEFSFDYVMLVIVASVISAVGLITNSVVMIVASMLVSPIMGPILAITFGATILDHDMVVRGTVSELRALFLCVLIGFIFGLGAAKPTYEMAVEDNTEWPPFEMVSRGTKAAILSGIPVAFFSGIGVALSVLGNNTTSLVGVAISASLLPPAVNTGVLLAYTAMIKSIRIGDDTDPGVIYEDPKDLVQFAGVSLGLTCLNIGLIIVAGIMMFHLKEVTPMKGKSEFWATHIQHARNYNTIVKNDERTASLLRQVRDAVRQRNPNATEYDSLAMNKRPVVPRTVLDSDVFVDPNAAHKRELRKELSRSGTEGRRSPMGSLSNILTTPIRYRKAHSNKKDKSHLKETVNKELINKELIKAASNRNILK
mmetsp:Transcript_14617/g.16576  ORF Transcript_14617/g.16576 Transcript_14617/m.16576 type:complete len:701 (-) Transcript_14617:763-2865(-)